MGPYIVRRLLLMVPVMLLVATTTFLLLHMSPGDPVAVLLGPDATVEQVEQMREELGLNESIPTQFLNWTRDLFRGDLGNSIFLNKPVTAAIAERAEPTLMITILASVIAIAIGVPFGIISAVRRGSIIDSGSMLIAMLGISMPTFWIGLNLAFLFGVTMRWLPPSGYQPLGEGIVGSLRYLILPSITLGVAQAALLARMTRSMMLEVLGEDYVRTARSKGVHERRVIFRHGLRNAFIPLMTVIGLTFAALMSGAVITEQVFNIPGVGRLLVQAVLRRDFPLVQGIVLVIAFLYVVINLVVDLIYVFLDPRIRYS